MTPALTLRVLAVLLLLAGFTAGVAVLYRQGYAAGAATERAAAERRETARKDAEAKAVAQRVRDNETLRATQERANLEDAQRHEQADLAVERERDRLRADVRRAGGLRVPCPERAGTAAQAEAPADGGSAAAPAGTVALPAAIEESLLAAAAYADQVTEQARALQRRVLEDAKEP